jgi:molybdate transport system regulatory protein
MTLRPQVSFRIDVGPGRKLGPGKVRLLQQIAETGSISGAARAMGMSYRRAWLLVEECNRLFDAPLVESVAGGSGGGGARLTALAERVVGAYQALQAEIDALTARRLDEAVTLAPGAASARRSPRT